MSRANTASFVHVVGAPSLSIWLPAFAGQLSGLFVVSGAEKSADELINSLMVMDSRSQYVLYSAHRTLVRDAEAAIVMRLRGRRIIGQELPGALSGTDKSLMKWLLNRAGVPTVPAVTSLDCKGPVVVKQRNGTEALGSRVTLPPVVVGPKEFAEPFVQGEEYSVNVHIGPTRAVTFPPVAKGGTRSDLLPPVKRLRRCFSGVIPPELDDSLRSLALRAMAACGATGFGEVEFIVEDGSAIPMVLEVNPRISGTMRISAMAAGVSFLELLTDGAAEHLAAKRVAVEAPYAGKPFCSLTEGVIATSRITVVADDLAAAMDRIRTFAQAIPHELEQAQI